MTFEIPTATDVAIRYLLERNASENPTATAVTFEEGHGWTWRDAVAEMYRGADVLRRHGVTQDARVGLFAPNGEAFLRAWWGANALGATLVPLNLAYKGTILQHALDVTTPDVVVVAPEFRSVLEEAKFDAAVCETGELAEGEPETPPLERPLEVWDINLVVFTSGTTGPSKASLTTNYQTVLTTSWFAEGWALGPEDRFLIDLPLFHLAAQSLAVSSIAARASLAVRRAPAVGRYWATAKEAQVTASALVSTMAPFLAAQPESPADR
ncbi:MAG TPA: AMP-binding protein, partial [Acidimicrobiia bacterium]|nr:AMP-binding protein [Acidimicrobiia bacterium]